MRPRLRYRHPLTTANKLFTLKENTSDKFFELKSFTEKVETAAGITSVKSSDTKLGSFYVNSNTKYIVIEGSGSNIDVTVKTGGLSYAGTSATATVIYTKDGSAKIASYVVLPVASFDAGASDDVLYVKSYDGKVDGGYAYTVYMADGSTKSIVATEDPYSATNTDGIVVKGAFYKYTTDSKDVYTLSAATALNITGDVTTWDSKVAAQTGVSIGAEFESVYNGLLTINKATGSYKLGDIEASDAKVIDLHETDNDEYTAGGVNSGKETYSGDVDSLDAMNSADDSGYTITIDLSVTEDGITVIFVKDVSRTVTP